MVMDEWTAFTKWILPNQNPRQEGRGLAPSAQLWLMFTWEMKQSQGFLASLSACPFQPLPIEIRLPEISSYVLSSVHT